MLLFISCAKEFVGFVFCRVSSTNVTQLSVDAAAVIANPSTLTTLSFPPSHNTNSHGSDHSNVSSNLSGNPTDASSIQQPTQTPLLPSHQAPPFTSPSPPIPGPSLAIDKTTSKLVVVVGVAAVVLLLLCCSMFPRQCVDKTDIYTCLSI